MFRALHFNRLTREPKYCILTCQNTLVHFFFQFAEVGKAVFQKIGTLRTKNKPPFKRVSLHRIDEQGHSWENPKHSRSAVERLELLESSENSCLRQVYTDFILCLKFNDVSDIPSIPMFSGGIRKSRRTSNAQLRRFTYILTWVLLELKPIYAKLQNHWKQSAN